MRIIQSDRQLALLYIIPTRALAVDLKRVQGAERDVIIFGITSSDPDHISSEFLNSPNRLNVAMTRAQHKLIIIGSRTFFSALSTYHLYTQIVHKFHKVVKSKFQKSKCQSDNYYNLVKR